MSVEAPEVVPLPASPHPEPAAKAIRKAFSTPWASLAVTVLVILWTIPTLGLLVTSVRPQADVSKDGWWNFFLHPHVTLSNYHDVLFSSGFGASGGLAPYFVNSLVIAVPGTLFPLAIATMAAYALAWVRFKGSDFIFFTVFALQVVPLQMALIPLLQFFGHGLHIGHVTLLPGPHLGGITTLWLAHAMFAMPLAIFLLHNFIAQLPNEVMEAARVDGANFFVTFRRIVLPLSVPAIASFGIFQFLWVWNDLLVALTFVGDNEQAEPITARLSELTGSLGSSTYLLSAGAFIAIVIPLIVFFSLQRFFVRGLLAGSVKG
jgi:alpha-glucoside transport system permease protein